MIIQSILVILAYFVLWYVVSLLTKNAGVVDIAWGFGFVVVAISGFLRVGGTGMLVMTLIVLIWGMRLSTHIFKRNVGKPEDFRYASFRREWGETFKVQSFFRIFMFQAVMMFIIALPIIFSAKENNIRSVFFLVLGVLVWLMGFVLEAVADYQLKVFIKNPKNKGQVIQTGLWAYSRHPNYFGEAVLWWGIYITGIGCGAPWYVVLGPITITLMLRYVTGVPMLEKRNMNKPGYIDYKERTSIFVPWAPKKGK